MTLSDLDKLAAEKIMGWTYDSGHDFYLDGVSIPYHGPDSDGPYWQPTRNIAQAWRCLEKFAKPGILIEIYRVPDLSTWDKYWNCTIQDSESGFGEHGETAPEAIVRACLKAKGVNIE